MNGRAAVLVLAVVLATFAAPAQAADPEGPRLAAVIDNLADESWPDIVTMGPTGEAPRVLVEEAGGNRPSWSADGSLLALGANGDWKGTVAAVAEADGPGLRFYRRASLEGSAPVMAPNGGAVAFAREKLVKVLPGRENYLYKSAIWFLNVKTGTVRRATPWRLQTAFEPSSFSPDGSKLAVTMFDQRGISAVVIDLRTGHTSPLAKEASEPTYSPDGSAVAFIRWKNWDASAADGRVPVTELRVAKVGSPRSRLLLHRHSLLASPSWDPSGSRLGFIASHVSRYEFSNPEKGDEVMEVNADGSCLTQVFSRADLVVSSVAWRPGSGREAGPISC